MLEQRDILVDAGFELFRDLGCYLSHDHVNVTWNIACSSMLTMITAAGELPEFPTVMKAASRLADTGTPSCARSPAAMMRNAELMSTAGRKDVCVAAAQTLRAVNDALLNQFADDYR